MLWMLNTEAKLRIVVDNAARIYKELLGLKVSRESINMNLSEIKVVLIKVEPALENNEDSFVPVIKEIKSEVPDEGTFTDVNETSCDVKTNFTEDNVLSNEGLVECKEFIEDDKVVSVTDKELKEEIVVKEESLDSSQEESEDIAAIESGIFSDDDTPLKKIKERQFGITLEEINTGAPARKRISNETLQKATLIKLNKTTMGGYHIANAVLKCLPINNCKALDVNFSEKLSADSRVNISKSKQIINSVVNYEVNNISPKVNIVSEDKIQPIDVIVQDHKTLTSKVCYTNAENGFKQSLPKSVDEVTPSTSLNRSDEGNKTNDCNKKGSREEFPTNQNKYVSYKCDLCDYRCLQKHNLAEHIKRKHSKEKNFSCHMCQYKCVTKYSLNVHLRKHTGEKPYVCDLCDRKFLRKNELKVHIRYKHTKEKNFSCYMCQYKCVTKYFLNVHLRKHTGEKPYTCDLCGNKFSQQNQLKSHIMHKHTQERNFSCHLCQYKSVTKCSLNVHLRKHTGEKPYTCNLCDNQFSQQSQLRSHKRQRHGEEKNFSCHVCHYKCVTKKDLNLHLPKHSEEEPFTCNLCDNRFSQQSQLRSHITHRHTEEKQFSCHLCHYKCVTKNNLNIHLRKHTEDKPYTCNLCDSKFSAQSKLRGHIMHKHTKEKNFSCHTCQYKCVTKGALNRHIRKHTGDKPYTCDLCDSKFSNISNLRRHIMHKHTKEKTFSCHLCPNKFVTKSNLNVHLRRHNGEKPYSCDLCDYRCSEKGDLKTHMKFKHIKEKNFSCHMCQYKCITKSDLNKHLRKHTGEKPYKCEICDFKSSLLSVLKSHLLSKHAKETVK